MIATKVLMAATAVACIAVAAQARGELPRLECTAGSKRLVIESDAGKLSYDGFKTTTGAMFEADNAWEFETREHGSATVVLPDTWWNKRAPAGVMIVKGQPYEFYSVKCRTTEPSGKGL